MPIYDFNGTTNQEIGKLYDQNGTTANRISKVYDYNNSTNAEIWTSHYYKDGQIIVSENGVDYWGIESTVKTSGSAWGWWKNPDFACHASNGYATVTLIISDIQSIMSEITKGFYWNATGTFSCTNSSGGSNGGAICGYDASGNKTFNSQWINGYHSSFNLNGWGHKYKNEFSHNRNYKMGGIDKLGQRLCSDEHS